MEKEIEINDIVTIIADTSFTDDEGNVQMQLKDCDGKVLFLFTNWNDQQACILEVNGIQTPFRLQDIKLKEKAPIDETRQEYPNPYTVIKEFVSTIPTWSLAYVYQINDKFVAARSIVEAIRIFYQSEETPVVIESVKLLSQDQALVQNEIPLI